MTLAPRLRTPLLAVAVALVLADSSVVTLALPDILRRYDASIDAIARVLTFYNGALALVAIPAGLLARGRARACAAVGAVGLAAASVVCAAAPTLDWLLAGRVGQAVAGALLAVAALELLAGSTGSRGGAAGVWTAAGVAGAEIGRAHV